MLGTIIEIEDNTVSIKLNIDLTKFQSLLNLHVVMQESLRTIIGEIVDIKGDIVHCGEGIPSGTEPDCQIFDLNQLFSCIRHCGSPLSPGAGGYCPAAPPWGIWDPAARSWHSGSR